MGEPLNLLGVHAPVLLPPAVIGRLRRIDDAADVGDAIALSDQLLSGCELAKDLLRSFACSFQGAATGPVWPNEGSHSPWFE